MLTTRRVACTTQLRRANKQQNCFRQQGEPSQLCFHRLTAEHCDIRILNMRAVAAVTSKTAELRLMGSIWCKGPEYHILQFLQVETQAGRIHEVDLPYLAFRYTIAVLDSRTRGFYLLDPPRVCGVAQVGKAQATSSSLSHGQAPEAGHKRVKGSCGCYFHWGSLLWVSFDKSPTAWGLY